jgi:hypothetical protein
MVYVGLYKLYLKTLIKHALKQRELNYEAQK